MIDVPIESEIESTVDEVASLYKAQTTEERSIVNNLGMMFPGLRAAEVLQNIPGVAKTFKGDGTGRIVLPGCRSITAVLINGVEVQPSLTNTFQTSDTITMEAHRWRFVDQVVPLYALVSTEDGPTLVRSEQSNDGIWQDGATITVIGEWEDSPISDLSTPDYSAPNNTQEVAQ